MWLWLLLLLLANPAYSLTCPPGAVTSCSGSCCCCCPGDADRNGFINSEDFATVADPANFGKPSQAPNGLGDADCNGFVNYNDYVFVQRNFGQPCAPCVCS